MAQPVDKLKGNFTAPVASTPALGTVTKDQTVQGQLGNIMSGTGGANSFLNRAKTRAAQSANQRGLLNSSMATQAGQEAVISTAMPVAQADAAQYSKQGLTNQGYQNQFNSANQQFGHTTKLADQGFGHQTKLADQGFGHKTQLAAQANTQQTAMADQAYNQQMGVNGYSTGLIDKNLGGQKELTKQEQDARLALAQSQDSAKSAENTLTREHVASESGLARQQQINQDALARQHDTAKQLSSQVHQAGLQGGQLAHSASEGLLNRGQQTSEGLLSRAQQSSQGALQRGHEGSLQANTFAQQSKEADAVRAAELAIENARISHQAREAQAARNQQTAIQNAALAQQAAEANAARVLAANQETQRLAQAKADNALARQHEVEMQAADEGTKKQLLALEANYNSINQTSRNAASLYSGYLSTVNTVQQNENMSAEQKTAVMASVKLEVDSAITVIKAFDTATMGVLVGQEIINSGTSINAPTPSLQLLPVGSNLSAGGTTLTL